MNKDTVLVTGASSGIGLELARTFARHGHDVVLSARSVDALEELAARLRAEHGVRAEVVAADLARPGAAYTLVQELVRRGIVVDVLVNNAGFAQRGAFTDVSEQRHLDMVQVNITAVVQLTRLLLPGMIERRRGGVLNTASTAAFLAGPYMAVYYATKAFVLSFTEALHEEVADTGVRVVALCPGPTDTGFVAEADLEGASLFKVGAQRPAEVAQVGFEALQRNRAIAISGIKNALGVFGGRLAPRAVLRRIAGALNR